MRKTLQHVLDELSVLDRDLRDHDPESGVGTQSVEKLQKALGSISDEIRDLVDVYDRAYAKQQVALQDAANKGLTQGAPVNNDLANAPVSAIKPGKNDQVLTDDSEPVERLDPKLAAPKDLTDSKSSGGVHDSGGSPLNKDTPKETEANSGIANDPDEAKKASEAAARKAGRA